MVELRTLWARSALAGEAKLAPRAGLTEHGPMAGVLVAWRSQQPMMEPTVGVSVDVTFSGEVEVEGAWPDALEWLRAGFGATALESFGALGLTPRQAPSRLQALRDDLLTRIDAAIGPHGMKALRITQLDVHVSEEGSRALTDIQSSVARAKEETQRRRSLPG